jgi:hypothetical protein
MMRSSPKNPRWSSIWLTLASVLCAFFIGCSTGSGAHVYMMGERAETGPMVYSVIEAQWRAQLGEGPGARIPQNRFLLLRLSVTNGSPRDISIPLTTLIAPTGETYGELTDGQEVTDWLGALRRLKPVETVFGWVAFDVPRGDYKLRVSDDAFNPEEAKTALIEVPLRFEAKADSLPDNKRVR